MLAELAGGLVLDTGAAGVKVTGAGGGCIVCCGTILGARSCGFPGVFARFCDIVSKWSPLGLYSPKTYLRPQSLGRRPDSRCKLMLAGGSWRRGSRLLTFGLSLELFNRRLRALRRGPCPGHSLSIAVIVCLDFDVLTEAALDALGVVVATSASSEAAGV